ncbi:MAG: hypothetical protein CVU89_11755 [Firmicutes bacterium HGW-Firmicutes-14]|jgi:uncharacterized membrane protein YheB (UPF0754 family)|nr:MAG: hypothetical protein CVU89_11755 [Firmicutes bacterium HGW-Firmicutes-14]
MKALLIIVPLIGAFTGWFIIRLALALLFRPYNVVNIPVIGVEVQGLLPRKKSQLAEEVTQIVETQLQLAASDKPGFAAEIRDSLTCSVLEAAEEHLEDKIPSLVPAAIKKRIINLVEDIIRKEIPGFLNNLANNMGNDGENECLGLLEDRIRGYNLRELEEKINKSRGILYIKTCAALVGFFSGLVQLGVVWLSAA